MDRRALQIAWADFYTNRGWPRAQIIEDITRRVNDLGGRMRDLARLKQSTYHRFNKARLVSALGMSMGVLKQMRWGLTFSTPGGNLKGGGRVKP